MIQVRPLSLCKILTVIPDSNSSRRVGYQFYHVLFGNPGKDWVTAIKKYRLSGFTHFTSKNTENHRCLTSAMFPWNSKLWNHSSLTLDPAFSTVTLSYVSQKNQWFRFILSACGLVYKRFPY